jgi:hypothetical protein
MEHPTNNVAIPIEKIVKVETCPDSCVHARIHLAGGEYIDTWEDFDDVMQAIAQ